MSEESLIKLRDVDEGLSIKILEKWDLAFNFFIEKRFLQCYRSLKGLYYMIRMYGFDGKQDLEEVTEAIDAHLTRMEGTQAVTEDEMINIGEAKYEFGELVDIYFKILPEAFNNLGKWLKVYKVNDDKDEQFSKETFGTNVKLVDDKREELKDLDKEEVIKLCSPNMVHFLHSRMLITRGK